MNLIQSLKEEGFFSLVEDANQLSYIIEYMEKSLENEKMILFPSMSQYYSQVPNHVP